MLAIITLRQQVAGPAEGTVAYTLAAIKDWTFLLGPGWVVGWGNGLILGYLMYRSGLVPRRATWLGLIGGPLIIVSGTAIMFTGNEPSHALHSLQAIVTIPEFAWELFLGVYCTIWGFRPRCPDPFGEQKQQRRKRVPVGRVRDRSFSIVAGGWRKRLGLLLSEYPAVRPRVCSHLLGRHHIWNWCCARRW